MRVHLNNGTTVDVDETPADLARRLYEHGGVTTASDSTDGRSILLVREHIVCGVGNDPAPDHDLEPEPIPEPEFVVYAHTPASRGDFWTSVLERPWADGAFVYYPGPWGTPELRWDEYWEEITRAVPEGLHTVVSPKAIDPDALRDFCDRLPTEWAEKMVFAYYQEPEDNHTTPEARARFRRQVALAAPIVRAAGIRNAVELQEWTLNPANRQPWGGEDNLAEFVNPDDVDHVSWSIYEYNLKDRIDDQVGRIVDFMARFPGLTWDASACGISVPVGTPTDSPERVRRAELTAKLAATVREAGATGFGWFDFPAWAGTRDYDVASDPHLTDVLTNL